MIKLKSIITGKKLRIFDFDGTLARSDARIIVKKPDGNQERLSSLDYAYYKLKPGESFSFREFGDEKLTEPKAIRYTMKILKNIYDRQTENHSVCILTARSPQKTDSIRKFLDTHGMSGVDIFALGDINPDGKTKSSDEEKKANWVEEKIKEGYNDILFFDDVPLNLQAVDRLKQKYPDVKIITRLIKPNFME